MGTATATDLEAAWRAAMERTPAGWFGPRVEPRWPNRWRAWVELADTSNGRRDVSVFATTEADALWGLAGRLAGGI